MNPEEIIKVRERHQSEKLTVKKTKCENKLVKCKANLRWCHCVCVYEYVW